MEKFRGIFSLVTDTNRNRLEYNSVHLSVKYATRDKVIIHERILS